MTRELAFVGDVHGNLAALTTVLTELKRRKVAHYVFLGDYINKGPSSAQVMSQLLTLQSLGVATLLAGNHELALLSALEDKDLRTFLKLGGARTIRSYVGHDVGPDVMQDFVASLPPTHVEALRRLPLVFEAPGILAQHEAPTSAFDGYVISAHSPVGDLPRIRRRSSSIDTGCGSQSGRLTALLWPSLGFVQASAQGELLVQDDLP
ncbi:MAG: metallophosphoesterase [Candidatus Nanopelagicales bacterium]